TGSMMCGDGMIPLCSQGVPPSHISSLAADATSIVNTLFSNSLDTSKLKIAVVPYVTAVNIGPAFSQSGTLDTYVPKVGGTYYDYKGNPITNSYTGGSVAYDPTQGSTSQDWKGCVVEPTDANEDTTGIGPDISEPAGG